MLVKRIVAVLAAMAVMVCAPMNRVSAAENTDSKISILPSIVTVIEDYSLKQERATTFSDTEVIVACNSNGMDISIHTSMTKTASVVGVKDITIDRKINGQWVTVATSTGGEVYNTIGCRIDLTYSGAIYNESYRITCVHYADVDGYRELYHETGTFIFTY